MLNAFVKHVRLYWIHNSSFWFDNAGNAASPIHRRFSWRSWASLYIYIVRDGDDIITDSWVTINGIAQTNYSARVKGKFLLLRCTTIQHKAQGFSGIQTQDITAISQYGMLLLLEGFLHYVACPWLRCLHSSPEVILQTPCTWAHQALFAIECLLWGIANTASVAWVCWSPSSELCLLENVSVTRHPSGLYHYCKNITLFVY